MLSRRLAASTIPDVHPGARQPRGTAIVLTSIPACANSQATHESDVHISA